MTNTDLAVEQDPRSVDGTVPGPPLSPQSGGPGGPALAAETVDEHGHAGSSWATLADGSPASTAGDDRPLSIRTVLLRVVGATVVVVLIVALAGLLASRRIAERQAVNDAAQRTDLMVDTVVQPAVDDGVLTGNPASIAKLAAAIKDHVLDASILRVKLWAPDGTILYSDEPRLIGQRFPLDRDEREAFTTPKTEAGITDLRRPENRFERSLGKSLEVYRPVWTPNAKPLLFETYSPYSAVNHRTGQLWRGFAGITLSSLLLLIALLVPILLTLLGRVRRAQRHREALLRHAVEASADERRRIAATVHDGVVQELAATSFALSGKAQRAASSGQLEYAADLNSAAAQVRTNIGSLRSLLVDIYPPNLVSAGLPAALHDLADTVRARDIDVRIVAPPAIAENLELEKVQLIFRVAQECLRNVVKHAGAEHVDIVVGSAGAAVTLDVVDDGVGFDTARVMHDRPDGHFGLRLLADLARGGGATLRVASEPGRGTHWRLEVAR